MVVHVQALALFKLAVQRASQHCQQLHEVCALTTRRLLESSKSVVIDIELAMSHVDAISSDELLALRKLTMSRRKEYDQGEEALDVTAKQLCSWASLLEGAAHYSAVFSGDTDVAIISDLLANDYPLATAHALGFVALLRLPDRLVNSLAAHALYTRKDVSPARSTVKCQRLMGLRGCMDVCVYDRGGVPLQSVSPLDVTVRFSRDTIQPVDAVITSAGTVRVIYQFSVPVLQPI
ncbi:MAG: hypothetical protein P4L40_07540, partial [Terracidiphilus sp.]|nr:hypothetical protein [Terracidiphilus sp.]